MPYSLNQNIIVAKELINKADAVLIISGAGIGVDSGIPTYRGTKGIWNKSINVGHTNYSYDEISSLKMWKENPYLAWGFKANFFQIMNNIQPHDGYFLLLEYLKKYDYFVCTSNIDGYFLKSSLIQTKFMKYMVILIMYNVWINFVITEME